MPTKLRNLTVKGQQTQAWEERVRGYGLRKSSIFTCNTTYNDYGYIQMLTNIPVRQEDTKYYILEAVGYNYGLASDIFCWWGFENSLEYNKAVSYAEGGLVVDSRLAFGCIYESDQQYDDDYRVVIVAFADSCYYMGFALNAYVISNSNSFESIEDVQVTAAVITNDDEQKIF